MMMSFFIFSVELMVSDISINVVIRKYDGNKIVREQSVRSNGVFTHRTRIYLFAQLD